MDGQTPSRRMDALAGDGTPLRAMKRPCGRWTPLRAVRPTARALALLLLAPGIAGADAGRLPSASAVVPPSAPAPSTPVLAARIRGSVALLRILDGSGTEVGAGTGFVIDGRRIATNAHVVDAASAVEILFEGRPAIAAEALLAVDRERDLAILSVPASAPLPPALELADATPQVGSSVLVVGAPLGYSGTVSLGSVSALRNDANRPAGASEAVARGQIVQITAAVSPGSSGSPVVDASGRVIGVAQSAVSAEVGQAVNFAVSVTSLRALAAVARAGTPVRDFRHLARTARRRLLVSWAGTLAAVVAVAALLVRRDRASNPRPGGSRWPRSRGTR